MRSSATSSERRKSRIPDAPPRKQFALTGRSPVLDPAVHAVRPDLADVRLADRVFAPHYAAPLPRVLLTGATLRAGRAQDAAILAQLDAGQVFELLDVTGDDAWGSAPAQGLAGYLPAAALGPAR